MKPALMIAGGLVLFFIACKSPDTANKEKPADNYTLAEQCRLRSSYDSAAAFYLLDIEENYKASNWPQWSKSVNGLIDAYRSNGDLEKAFTTLSRFDSIARNKINVRSEIYASLLHKKAVLLSDKTDFAGSTFVFQSVINLRQSLKLSNDTSIALAFNGIGTNYLYLSSYDTAFIYYMKAINNYDSLGRNRTADFAMFNQNLGIIYALKGNYKEADEHFQLSLAVNKAILDKNDPKLALVYLNLGRFFNLTGNDEKALEVLTQSEEIFKLKDKNSQKLASIYLNIGAIYVVKANYEKALSYYNKALAIIQSKSSGNQSDLLTVFLNLGFIMEKKGDYIAANSFYLQGLQKGDKYPNSLKVLRGLANISYLQNKNLEASRYYELALKKSMEVNGEEHPETALTYFKYGEFCSLTGERKKALEYMEKGLSIYKLSYGDKNRDVGYGYLVIANFYDRNKEYQKALNYFQKAIIAGFTSFNDPDVFKNPSPDKGELNYMQLNMISGKASVFYSMYAENENKTEYLNESAKCYDLALEMVELLRSTYQEEDSKLLIAGNEKITVIDAIRTQVALYNRTGKKEAIEKAFTYSEKGKSSVLLSYLRDMEAKDLGKIPDNLRKQDNKLKSDIAFYNKLIFEESTRKNADQEKVNMWNNMIFEFSRQHDSLIKVIENKYPAYYNLKYDNSVISIKDTRNKLLSNQAFVEYSMSDSILYIFAISKDNYGVYTSTLDKQFYDDLKTVRDMLTGKSFNNYSPEDYKLFTTASHSLYVTVLLPVEHIVKGKDLIIVPDAELGFLSFDILLTKPAPVKAKGYRSLPYLIKEVPVSYAPSATALFEGFRNPEAKGNKQVLAFAPSYENIKNVKVDELLRGKVYRDYLLPIPGAQVEVQKLKKVLRSNVYEGSSATEGNFKRLAGDYSILHLAMHTVINNKNPLYSKLVFYHSKDNSEDGLLNTSELFGMQLNADLAVLSACNTGTGKLEKGEGIMSLSRGFFYAGVPSIVMTSWAVEDQSGSELMSSFYKYLAEGKPKNECLRLAKLDYLEQSDQLKSHPHFWAAYMTIGDISPIQGLKRPIPWMIIFISAGGLLIIAGVFLFLRKRRKA
ncbi:MAG: CHAT domain-containing protein [Bacteroidales bacterium]|nr:CHAT domain-containing protein [Bacteroidales bacterium]